MTGDGVWVVTGASRGIGASIARMAFDAGQSVAMIARGKSVVELAQSLGEAAAGFQGDVADSASVSETVDEIVARFGGVNVLVNNAGVHRGGKIHRLTDEAWQEVLQVNLTGAMNMTRAALPHLEEYAPKMHLFLTSRWAAYQHM